MSRVAASSRGFPTDGMAAVILAASNAPWPWYGPPSTPAAGSGPGGVWGAGTALPSRNGPALASERHSSNCWRISFGRTAMHHHSLAGAASPKLGSHIGISNNALRATTKDAERWRP